MGDFNFDPIHYHNALLKGKNPPPFGSLISFLSENNFIEQYPLNEKGLEYMTFYANNHNIPTSRIDHIWFNEDLLTNEFCFSQVWQPPCSILSTHTHMNLDHRSIILFFTKALFIGNLPIHRRKQKNEWRTFFNVKDASTQDWMAFTSHIFSNFSPNDSISDINVNSPVPLKKLLLNSMWVSFKQAVTNAANAHIP